MAPNNNTPATATRSGLNNNFPNPSVIFEGRLNPNNQVDHYAFNVRAGQVRSFRAALNYPRDVTPQASPNADFDLELLRRNVDGTFTSIGSAATRGRVPEVLNQNLSAGAYVIRVQRVSGRGTYRLNLLSSLDRVSDDFSNPLVLPTIGAQGLTTAGEFLGGRGGDRDFYRFTVDRPVNLTLQVLQPVNGVLRVANNASVNVALLGASETRVLATSSLAPTGSGGSLQNRLNRILGPGTYTIRVTSNVGTNGRYALRLFAPEAPDTGGSEDAPIDVGQVAFGRPLRREEYVGQMSTGVDETDAYRFTAGTTGKLTARLTDLSSDADLELYDESSVLQIPILGTPTSDGKELTFDVTSGSSYKLVVRRTDANNSGFTLSASIKPLDRVGDTFATATSLNTPPSESGFPPISRNTQEYSDFAGTVGEESDVDIFRLDLNQRRNFLRLNLTGLSSNLDVRLWQENPSTPGQPRLVLASTTPGTANEFLAGNLSRGTYYIEILPGSDSSESLYNLELSVKSGGTVPTITRDIFADAGDAQAQNLTNVNGILFFTALDGTRDLSGNDLRGLWRSDGTLNGTLRLAQFRDISNLRAVNGSLYFTATEAGGTPSLYRWQSSDDNETGVVTRITGQSGAPQFSNPRNLQVVGENIFFEADAPTEGLDPDVQLYWTNGTAIRVIANSGGFRSNFTVVDRDPLNATTADSDLFYTAFADGISGGTVLHRIENAGSASADNLVATPLPTLGARDLRGAFRLFAVQNPGGGSSLFFAARELSATANQLFRFDLTQPDGVTSYTINSGGDSIQSSTSQGDPFVRAQFGGQEFLFFAATGNDMQGNELWQVNLTTNAASLVQDIWTDSFYSSNPSNFVVSSIAGSDRIFFIADAGSGPRIYTYNGTTTTALPGGFFDPENLVIAGGSLYFTASTHGTGRELWELNLLDPAAQPELVEDIRSGSASSEPNGLVNIQGQLYFIANDGLTGNEVWTVGGTDDDD